MCLRPCSDVLIGSSSSLSRRALSGALCTFSYSSPLELLQSLSCSSLSELLQATHMMFLCFRQIKGDFLPFPVRASRISMQINTPFSRALLDSKKWNNLVNEK